MSKSVLVNFMSDLFSIMVILENLKKLDLNSNFTFILKSLEASVLASFDVCYDYFERNFIR